MRPTEHCGCEAPQGKECRARAPGDAALQALREIAQGPVANGFLPDDAHSGHYPACGRADRSVPIVIVRWNFS